MKTSTIVGFIVFVFVYSTLSVFNVNMRIYDMQSIIDALEERITTLESSLGE